MSENRIHEGDLNAKPGVIYEYEQIIGSLYATGADTKTAFPKLTTIGGWLHATGADTKTAFPKLTTVGGSLHANGADTKTAFPKLTTVGGSLYATGADTKTAFPKLKKTNDPEARAICRKSIFDANLKIGYYFADGILARLINRRGRVARVIIYGKTDVSYVVEDRQGNYSHGATLKQAREGLIYKLTSRDTSQFKSWKRSTLVSPAKAIQAYRAITGACETGTKHFCQMQGKLPDKLKIADVITRTKGQFGAEKFAAFFQG